MRPSANSAPTNQNWLGHFLIQSLTIDCGGGEYRQREDDVMQKLVENPEAGVPAVGHQPLPNTFVHPSGRGEWWAMMEEVFHHD